MVAPKAKTQRNTLVLSTPSRNVFDDEPSFFDTMNSPFRDSAFGGEEDDLQNNQWEKVDLVNAFPTNWNPPPAPTKIAAKPKVTPEGTDDELLVKNHRGRDVKRTIKLKRGNDNRFMRSRSTSRSRSRSRSKSVSRRNSNASVRSRSQSEGRTKRKTENVAKVDGDASVDTRIKSVATTEIIASDMDKILADPPTSPQTTQTAETEPLSLWSFDFFEHMSPECPSSPTGPLPLDLVREPSFEEVKSHAKSESSFAPPVENESPAESSSLFRHIRRFSDQSSAWSKQGTSPTERYGGLEFSAAYASDGDKDNGEPLGDNNTNNRAVVTKRNRLTEHSTGGLKIVKPAKPERAVSDSSVPQDQKIMKQKSKKLPKKSRKKNKSQDKGDASQTVERSGFKNGFWTFAALKSQQSKSQQSKQSRRESPVRRRSVILREDAENGVETMGDLESVVTIIPSKYLPDWFPKFRQEIPAGRKVSDLTTSTVSSDSSSSYSMISAEDSITDSRAMSTFERVVFEMDMDALFETVEDDDYEDQVDVRTDPLDFLNCDDICANALDSTVPDVVECGSCELKSVVLKSRSLIHCMGSY